MTKETEALPMSDSEIIKELVQYGRGRYPKLTVDRTSAPSGAPTLKEFIESLTYGDEKQGQKRPS